MKKPPIETKLHKGLFRSVLIICYQTYINMSINRGVEKETLHKIVFDVSY